MRTKPPVHRKPKPPAGRGLRHDTGAMTWDVLGRILWEQDSRRLELASRLHRDVAGSLVACAAVSEMIRDEVEHGGDSGTVRGMLANLQNTLRQTIQYARELTAEEFPPVLRAFGLCCQLEEFVSKMSRDHPGIAVAMVLDGDEPNLTQSQRLSLCEVMQSLILSCIRQTKASRINVTCSFCPKKVEFRIDHNGQSSLLDSGDLTAIWARLMMLGAKSHATTHGLSVRHRLRLVIPLPAAAQFSSRKSLPHPSPL